MAVGVAVGTGVAVLVAVAVGVGAAVAVADGLGVGETTGVAEGLGVAVAGAVDGVDVGVGVAPIAPRIGATG